MPKADATGLAPEKSADHNPSRTPFVCAGGLPSAVAPRCFYFQPLHGPSTTVPSQNSKPISLVKSLSGGLGLKTRRPPGCLCRALRIPIFFALLLLGYRSRLHRRVSYPTRALSRLRRLVRPKRNPRNWPENSQTSSGENSVTRYIFGSGVGGLLMRFGPFRTGRDSCAFSSLVSSGQPQFLFLYVPFLSESKRLAKDAQKPQKGGH
jgi:hypothetical protein